MEVVFAILIGAFFASSIYMLLSKHIIRILIGIVLIGNAVNLLIFTSGRLSREVPPIIPADQYLPIAGSANPLPQALILTAIVISFSIFAFLLVLVYRTYLELGKDNIDEMQEAESRDTIEPPTGY